NLTIHGDANLLMQALINLIRNAAGVMAEHPTRPRQLRLEAAPAEARTPEGRSVPMHALRVHDSGPGIDAATADKLFTPFFTTSATGTGLGLAIVHRIADAHGGRVSLRSRASPVEGATAELLLPVPPVPPDGSGS
ncbi:MAG: hypothetical protein K2Q09_04840, partial [Phycisphaerales bacterium]|nr:hypothetical protein [Phycisphaerales bacterium]